MTFFFVLIGGYRKVVSATPQGWLVTSMGWLHQMLHKTKVSENSASAVLTQGGVGREVSFKLSYI